MSLFKKNSLAVALVGAAVLSVAALQGCSSDEQSKPAGGAGSGSGGSSHAGAGGKPSTAGGAGEPEGEGGSAGQVAADGGMAGELSMGGEGGAGPAPACDLSFDNSTLEAITDNGGKLPDL